MSLIKCRVCLGSGRVLAWLPRVPVPKVQADCPACLGLGKVLSPLLVVVR